MIVKTKDDQQYGVVTRVVKNGVYIVQCYGHLPRVGPWLRKCTLIKTYRCSAVDLSIDDVVLIGYNYQDKKTGAIAYTYNETEKHLLVRNAEAYEVPSKLVELLEEEAVALSKDTAIDDTDSRHS